MTNYLAENYVRDPTLEDDYRRSLALETNPLGTQAGKRIEQLYLIGDVKKIILITAANTEDPVRIVSNMRVVLSSVGEYIEAESLYFSLLLMLIPSIKEQVVASLQLLKIEFEEIDWEESNWVDELRDWDSPRMDVRWSLVALGQLLFIPFKNLSSANYSEFMTRRTAAMCAYVGVDPNDFGLPLAETMAINLRLFLNGLRGFKNVLLDFVLAQKAATTAGMNDVFTYVADILSWSDMVVFVLIRDELVRTNTALMGEQSLLMEWSNYFTAVKTIQQYKYTQYFAIQASSKDATVVRRQNFRTLAAIALHCARYASDTAKQIVGLPGKQGKMLQKYLDIHFGEQSKEKDQYYIPMTKMLPSLIQKDVYRNIQTNAYIASMESDLEETVRENKSKKRARHPIRGVESVD